MGKTERQSNLELLRIVSIILIVMSHCDEIFGLSKIYSHTLGVNKLITDWLHMGGQIGVGCFVLISGYFMVEQRQPVTVKKVLKIAGEVWFYTISVWALWVAKSFYVGDFKLNLAVKKGIFSFFPILTNHYWFVTAYILLMIMSPYLNILIHAMDKEQYTKFMYTTIIIFVVLMGGFTDILPGMIEGRFIPVVIVYFIAGYIRRFGENDKGSALKHFVIAAIFYIVLIASFYLITYIGLSLDNNEITKNCYYLRNLNSPIVIIICTELFICFTKIKMKYHKAINYLAGCSFGIYLIHKNKIVEKILYKLFPVYKEHNSFMILVYSILGVAAICVGCTLIDIVRRATVEKLWNKFLDKKF